MAERRSQQTSVVFAAGSETHEGDCATVLMDETNNGCDWVQSVHRQCDDDATSYRCALCSGFAGIKNAEILHRNM